MTKIKFIDRYTKFLNKYKFFVLAFWLLLFGASIFFAVDFIGETVSDFDSPVNSQSYLANKILEEEFPGFADETSLAIVIRENSGNTALTEEIRVFSYSLIDYLLDSEYNSLIEDISGFFFFNDTGMVEIAMNFVSEDLQSTIIVINFKLETDQSINGITSYTREFIADEVPTEYTAVLTGSKVMLEDMQEASKQDIIRMDAIVLPIALLILALVVRSFRLLVVPIVSLLCTISIAFSIMLPIAKATTVFSFVPSIMMSLVIALSIDYALFLLSRYKEEIEKGKSSNDAISTALEHAGHTITVSGVTLAVSFLGLMLFPVAFLSTIGLGSAIAIVVALAANLILAPTLIFIFPKFFSRSALMKNSTIMNAKTEDERRIAQKEKQQKSFWYRVGKFTTKRKNALTIVMLVLLIAIPISLQTINMDTTMDNAYYMPEKADSHIAYNILKEDFNPGIIGPIYLIIKTDDSQGVLTRDFFNVSQSLILRMVEKTEVAGNSFISITFAQGNIIPYDIVMNWFFNEESSFYNTSEAVLYRGMFNLYTNSDNSSSIIEIQPNFDPFGDYMNTWVKDVREILDDFSDNTEYDFYLAGGPTEVIDTVDLVYAMFPWIILLVVSVVYVFLAVMFRSFILPLRSIFTIGLTISWIYGLTELIFNIKLFEKLYPVLSDVDSLYWATPIMSFSILLGLGLDYDIFLLSRISEYRNKGFTNRASVIKGLYKTGVVITMAGVIMAVAFSGLMLSSVLILVQFGFILALGVLIDTFIVRAILVPSIMSLLGKFNWWPGRKPEELKDELEIE